MFELTDGRAAAFQWDTGVYVDCTGLTESDEVHFYHTGMMFSVVPTKDEGRYIARIPDELLQYSHPINIYAYVHTKTGNTTKVEDLINVIARPKPADYIFTPKERKTWENLQEQIGDLADLKTQDKTSLVAGINEAMTQGGAADPEAVQQIVEDYLAENPPTVTETDPTVPEWAKAAQKPSYTAFEVGADPSGTAASQVSAHNTGTDTHSDIRLLISGLTDRLNALADSDDTTLDQLSEVVAYIKNNRSLVEAITTNKVSVADIIDNLTTNVTNKPLSAAQGVALKALIDGIVIPDNLPNPNALTFAGAVTGSYDGSEAMTVEIPSGGGGGITGFRRVVDTTLTEAAEIVNLTTDINGNTFSLSECYLFIEAACTEPTAITYIPNGYWNAGTYMISGSKTATDYPYIYIAYACGGSDHFFGFELKHRTGASMINYISNNSAHLRPITSYKLAGKFAEGARFIIFGRDA